MQAAVLWSAVAVALAVLRLGVGSPLPPVAAAVAARSSDPAGSAPPAAALSQLQLLLENERPPATSDPAAEEHITLRKREASPALSLLARLVRRDTGHSQQKREASPVTSTSLSINNSLRVLRRRVMLEQFRRNMLRKQQQIKENSKILLGIGKRSVRAQLHRHRQRTSDDRLTQNMAQ